MGCGGGRGAVDGGGRKLYCSCGEVGSREVMMMREGVSVCEGEDRAV